MAAPKQRPGESDAAYQKRLDAWAKQQADLEIPAFNPSDPDTAKSGDDEDAISGRFGLTGARSGLRSPDAIDHPSNVLNITTSIGVQSLPPEVMSDLQQQMKQAGLLPAGFNEYGDMNATTMAGLRELKAAALSSGLSDLDALRQRIEQNARVEAGEEAAKAAGKAAVDLSRTETRTDSQPSMLTDPLTIRAMFRDTLTQRLGRAPTADEYHQARQAVQNSEGGQDTSTTVTKYGRRGQVKSTVTTPDDRTTDPNPADVLDDLSRRGALGREANTVQAADFFDIIRNRVGGQ